MNAKALLFLLASQLALVAQNGIDQLVIMAGTSTVDTQGRHWAYLAWHTTDTTALRSRTFAVYAKPGDATSAAPYERQAIVRIQTDPLVIQPLLQRSVQLGQDLAQLDETINNLFERLTPDPTLPLAQKLSAVIRGSQDNPDHFKNLVLLSRVHPAVGLCLGWAHASSIPGPVGSAATFELRGYDSVGDRDLGVMGRTTVRAGQPVILPAPGAPVELPDITPKGDLNAKLRWATPDNLRRLSMLQHGFNIYRVPRATAEAANFHVVPPTPSTLLALVQSNPTVHRLNHVPVLNPRDFTAAEATDLLSDATTFFFSDWNDRFNPATAMPQHDFVNGAQFYYFVTARDLLGRDGLVSPGTLVTICDRMPPAAPRRVRVENHYSYGPGGAHQKLQVIWQQNEPTPLDTTTAYYVYRWTSLTQMHAHASQPLFNLVAGPIAHLPGSPTNSFLDNGIVANHEGATLWYTIVAVDAGACAPGGNRSPHSAPAFGVLRDREGPSNGGGSVEITCTRPDADFNGTGTPYPGSDLATNAFHYRVTTQRQHPKISWAEYWYEITGITTERLFLGRHSYEQGGSSVGVDLSVPRSGLPPNPTLTFHCRVGSVDERVSDVVSSSLIAIPPEVLIRPVLFSGRMESHRTSPDGDCHVHDPHGGDGDTVEPICLTANLTPGTREVKFYRRVENGPITLVCQREANFADGVTSASCCDGSVPAQSSEICYFAQLFDEHGNASPMTRINCVKTAPNAPMATPILSPIVATGSSTDASLRLQWFCPRYGIERFEVWIAGYPLAPAKKISPDLTLTNQIELGIPLPGVIPDPKLMTFLTRRIGPVLGTGPVFTVDVEAIEGNNYTVFIRAVGKDGSVGPRSNVERVTWHTPPAVAGSDVPWPARPLPPLTLTNFPGVLARMFHTNDPIFDPHFPQQALEGVGVRVGAVHMQYPVGLTNAMPGTADPLDHVYRSARDHRPLFPLVVYRTQVPNADFPSVSGDVVQVTPLMEQVAFQRQALAPGNNIVHVHDPFLRLVPIEETPGAMNWELYLLDTQPVIEAASYQYFLVRLDPDTREITEVVSTNPVLVQP
jgi:hypothetical protein